MTWLGAVRTWLARPRVAFTVGLLMVAYVIYVDGHRVIVSTRLGHGDWIAGVVAGVGGALAGVVMAVRAMRKRARGIAPSRLGLWLGTSYTIAMTVIFIVTPPGAELTADNPLLVGVLTCQVVLGLAFATMIVYLIRTGGRTHRTGAEQGEG